MPGPGNLRGDPVPRNRRENGENCYPFLLPIVPPAAPREARSMGAREHPYVSSHSFRLHKRMQNINL
jgi:hypothetical protein